MQKQTSNKTLKEATYKKVGLITSPLFSVTDKDILKLVLKDDQAVTMKQARELIKKFKEGI